MSPQPNRTRLCLTLGFPGVSAVGSMTWRRRPVNFSDFVSLKRTQNPINQFACGLVSVDRQFTRQCLTQPEGRGSNSYIDGLIDISHDD